MPRRSREFIITLTARLIHRVHRDTRVGIRDGGRSPHRRDRGSSYKIHRLRFLYLAKINICHDKIKKDSEVIWKMYFVR